MRGCSKDGAGENERTLAQEGEATYPLDISISCSENLVFSGYDVNVCIDGIKIGTIDYGASKTFNVELPEGAHMFRVEENGRSSVDGSEDFAMAAEESVLTCSLYCTSNQVKIEDFSAKTKAQAAADEEWARLDKEREEAERVAEKERKAQEKAAEDEREAQEKAEADAAAALRRRRRLPNMPRSRRNARQKRPQRPLGP